MRNACCTRKYSIRLLGEYNGQLKLEWRAREDTLYKEELKLQHGG